MELDVCKPRPKYQLAEPTYASVVSDFVVKGFDVRGNFNPVVGSNVFFQLLGESSLSFVLSAQDALRLRDAIDKELEKVKQEIRKYREEMKDE